jgi:aspartyl-tRNA synthetase
VRIHNPATQRHVLQHILGVPSDRIEATFGHLLESLGSGCPPHAGFALGVDRLISLAVGPERAPSIRDVIAFPKSHTGMEVLSGAPSAVSADVLEEFGLCRLPVAGGRGGTTCASGG